ncbi:MAG: S8 family serine peptidase [Acidobacteria bacterium]|nr:S8 family serine peptidase [Acidobacteriota bacterium]
MTRDKRAHPPQRLSLWLTLSALLLLTAAARADNKKLSNDLRHVDQKALLDVIVQYKTAPGPAKYEHIVKLGGSQKRELDSIRGSAIHLPAGALGELAQDPDVVYISPDRPISSFLANAAPAINAPYAWSSGYDGGGIGIAVVDSGISPHDDLNDSSGHSRVIYSANFASDSGTDDQYGHGEHVAGIIAGSGRDSICGDCFSTMRGIAPNSKLINLRALDHSGQGSDSSVIAAIDAAIQLKSSYSIRVLNLSLGRPVYESYKLDPLCQAVEAAWNAGIVVVVAAGNDGRDNSVGDLLDRLQEKGRTPPEPIS